MTEPLPPDGYCLHFDALRESTMALEKELAAYEKNLPQWKEHEGKFVLIHGDEVIDFFSSYEDAIRLGYQRFALTPFLVKQVQTVQVVQYVTRLVTPFAA
jgi:hypothetical protein